MVPEIVDLGPFGYRYVGQHPELNTGGVAKHKAVLNFPRGLYVADYSRPAAVYATSVPELLAKLRRTP